MVTASGNATAAKAPPEPERAFELLGRGLAEYQRATRRRCLWGCAARILAGDFLELRLQLLDFIP